MSDEKGHIATFESERGNDLISEPFRESVSFHYALDVSKPYVGIPSRERFVDTIYNSFEDRNSARANEGENLFHSVSANEIIQESEGKSSDVIMTNVNFAEKIYINENEIIGIWSQNISSQPRILYHKIWGKYPDGSSFWGESDHIQIQPGKSLYTYFTVYNSGRGIGFFDFTCEVWEEIDSWPDIKHDWKSNYYLATFYKPAEVSDAYYCDDRWHHPSHYGIYEKAFKEAGGCKTPREAALALMNFVHNYVDDMKNHLF